MGEAAAPAPAQAARPADLQVLFKKGSRELPDLDPEEYVPIKYLSLMPQDRRTRVRELLHREAAQRDVRTEAHRRTR